MAGLEEAFDRVGASLEHHLTASHAAGAALALTDREEILGVVVRGMADVASRAPVRPETRFQIGSISKSFSSIVAMQEVDAGRLDLHVSVNELLRWLGLPEPFGPITMHHLLTHTAGLHTGSEDAPGFAGALQLLRANPATFPPGTRFHYSNDGYKIVGAVLEALTGLPIHELLAERLLGPLGMSASVAAITDDVWTDLATGYEPLLTDRPAQLRHPLASAPRTISNTADGSIVSTVVDMCAYARLLLARGDAPDGRGGRILSEGGFARLMAAPYVDEDGPYGYGLWSEVHDGRTWLGHSGGMVGYTALVVTVPEEGLGCVILQNGGGDKRGLMASALAAVSASLAGEALPEAWAPPAATAIPDAERYVGTYTGDDGRTLVVDALEDGLRVTVGPVSARLERDPLEAEIEPTFLVAHPALERHPLEFRSDANGRAVEAFHGGAWFRGEAYGGPEPEEPPPGWRRHPGLYRNDDPWAPVLRVVLRKGRLAISYPTDAADEEGGDLVPQDDGSFAVGDPAIPRRVRFEGDVNGATATTVVNGGRWYRSFEP
ncbi:MAG TPA: serine hydrolase domain-containing protein [Actinomycetota bacterium]|nr:serine hydrolase domain-containing protein [Actinomycetota bacterium]